MNFQQDDIVIIEEEGGNDVPKYFTKQEQEIYHSKQNQRMYEMEKQISNLNKIAAIQGRFFQEMNSVLGVKNVAFFSQILKELEERQNERESQYNKEDDQKGLQVRNEIKIQKKESKDKKDMFRNHHENINSYTEELKDCLSYREIDKQQNSGKIKVIETILVSQNIDIKERMMKSEFMGVVNEFKDQLYSLNKKMDMAPDISFITNINDKLADITSRIEKHIEKEEVNQMITQQTKEMKKNFQEIYSEKQEMALSLDKLTREITQKIEKQSKIVKQNDEDLKDRLKNLIQQLQTETSNHLLLKQQCEQLVKFQEFNEQKNRIEEVLQEKVKLAEKVHLLQKFIEHSDESLLFRATRMDLEIAVQDIKKNYTSNKVHESNKTEQKQSIDLLREDIKIFIANAAEQLQSKLTDINHKDIKEALKIEVAKYFLRYDLHKIETIILQMTEDLPKKADSKDILQIQMEYKMKDKFNQKLSQQILTMNQYIKQLSISNCQFMRIAQGEFMNVRHQEAINKSISQIEQIQDQLFQQKLSSAGQSHSPTLKAQLNKNDSSIISKTDLILNNKNDSSYKNISRCEQNNCSHQIPSSLTNRYQYSSKQQIEGNSEGQKNNTSQENSLTKNSTPKKVRAQSSFPPINKLFTNMNLPIDIVQNRASSPIFKLNDDTYETNNSYSFMKQYGSVSKSKKLKISPNKYNYKNNSFVEIGNDDILKQRNMSINSILEQQKNVLPELGQNQQRKNEKGRNQSIIENSLLLKSFIDS